VNSDVGIGEASNLVDGTGFGVDLGGTDSEK